MFWIYNPISAQFVLLWTGSMVQNHFVKHFVLGAMTHSGQITLWSLFATVSEKPI